jgi:hypothetical protein
MSDAIGRDQHPAGADNGEEVAAYALGALDPAEAEAFARHLHSCAICRDELEAFRGVVELLPLTVEAEAVPAALRRRVLREVRSDARRQGRPAEATTSPARKPRGGWTVVRAPRFAPALAGGVAALVLVIAGLGGFSASAPTQRTIRAQVIGPGRASLRIAGGHTELEVAGLPAPPPGRIYEVWLERRHSRPLPTAALFSVTRSGSGDVMVPGDTRGVVEVMVTPEPVGGSPRPTRPPIIVARI